MGPSKSASQIGILIPQFLGKLYKINYNISKFSLEHNCVNDNAQTQCK